MTLEQWIAYGAFAFVVLLALSGVAIAWAAGRSAKKYDEDSERMYEDLLRRDKK